MQAHGLLVRIMSRCHPGDALRLPPGPFPTAFRGARQNDSAPPSQVLEGLEQMEPGEMVSLMEGFGPEEGMLRFDGTPLDTGAHRRGRAERSRPGAPPGWAHPAAPM